MRRNREPSCSSSSPGDLNQPVPIETLACPFVPRKSLVSVVPRGLGLLLSLLVYKFACLLAPICVCRLLGLFRLAIASCPHFSPYQFIIKPKLIQKNVFRIFDSCALATTISNWVRVEHENAATPHYPTTMVRLR